MVGCFEDYAEGHNYLGLIALERDRRDEAIDRYRRTVERGRRLFPRRIARGDYWRDIQTRPCMRGKLERVGHRMGGAGANRICRLPETDGSDRKPQTAREGPSAARGATRAP